jgi:hypothetical protein
MGRVDLPLAIGYLGGGASVVEPIYRVGLVFSGDDFLTEESYTGNKPLRLRSEAKVNLN